VVGYQDFDHSVGRAPPSSSSSRATAEGEGPERHRSSQRARHSACRPPST
jgi:hypothetical protein